MEELGGEKIDIIEWNKDLAKFIQKAMSPAKALGVKLDEKNGMAVVKVAPEQLSLAIGKKGQNVRLASKLTGIKIDVVGAEPEPAAEEQAIQAEGKVESEKTETKAAEETAENKETKTEPKTEEKAKEDKPKKEKAKKSKKEKKKKEEK